MIITKARIENFKSIESLEIPFDKVGDSYTKIFVGVNESGKSNILEALSYFDVPEDEVSFDHFCNQKNEDNDSCSVCFTLDFEDGEELSLQKVVNDCINSDITLEFSITDIEKHVYLSKGSTSFESYYDFKVSLNDGLYIKAYKQSGSTIISVVDETLKTDGYDALTESNFEDYFYEIIHEFVEENEPNVSVWKPSRKYLLCDANLNAFKENISSNKPLCNIFKLSGYETKKAIVEAIEKVANPRNRSKLESKLNDSLNEYISNVWSNSIDLIIQITETGAFSLLIKDKGNENKHDRFSITERSQGAQQFLSLILSLSLETKNHERKNELILIDEPEVHLHPSGIRDIAKELLKIGQENYVFLATHSPFMIDKQHKERHYIVKKNKKAITELYRIKESDNIIDDEVLREAFGIDVYKDLLNPHSVLVEGASDKLILQKALGVLKHDRIGITNGHGSNITTLVSKLNYDNINVLVVLDDDEDGKKDKNKILKIGGVYTEDNVFTIRELVGDIIDKGTIEDLLDLDFVKVQFVKLYKKTFGENVEIELQKTQPVIKQIIDFLKSKKLYSKWDMDAFKKNISEEFNPSKTALSTKHVLLGKLANSIIEKLK